jgi:hypothetical protein
MNAEILKKHCERQIRKLNKRIFAKDEELHNLIMES